MVVLPTLPCGPTGFLHTGAEARGRHLAEMALPFRWSLQSPACEPSTSPSSKEARTHSWSKGMLVASTNPLAASLWRCAALKYPE